MVKEVDAHIQEEAGTIKKKTQRFFIAVMVIVSIAFVVGLISMIQAENEDKEAAKKAEAAKTQTQEQQPVVATSNIEGIEDFEQQVSEKQKQAERKKESDKNKAAVAKARADARKAKQPVEQLTTEANPQGASAYDDFKANAVREGKARTLADMRELASAEVRLSKALEDFEVEEKQRALAARSGKFTLKPIKTETNKPQLGAAKLNLSPTEDRATRIAKVKAKAEEARKLRESIERGDFEGADSVQDLNQRLRNLSLDTPAKPRFSSVVNNDNTKRVVGTTQARAEAAPIENGVKLPTGTVIKAVLMQNIISDYANKPFKAQITQDIYDADYETILFPKGTIIDGRSIRISNINEPIQARMGLTVNWFVLPNGNRIDFNKSASALDATGIGAVKDEVDHHLLEQFLGVAAYAVIASEANSNTTSTFTGNTDIQGDIESSFRRQIAPLASRYLGLVPTITLKTGLPITIYIENEMNVQPWGTIYDELI